MQEACYPVYMKATIDIPDDLYRQLKAKSSLEGRPVRRVAIELFEHWIEGFYEKESTPHQPTINQKPPSWFGALRKYAANARGHHDLDSVRENIAHGWMKSSHK